MIRKCVVAMLLSIGAPMIAGAQSVTAVRVVRMAAVLEQPVGDARSLGSVGTGEILDVVGERDDSGADGTWRVCRHREAGRGRQRVRGAKGRS